MFVYYYLHVDRPIDEAKEIVARLLDGLTDAADIAYRHGEELRMRAVAGKKAIAKTVRLETGSPVSLNGGLTVPIAWEATGTPGLFPEMEADLILAPVGPNHTQIALRGTYRPPLGTIGEILDAAVLHRVAEATVKHFVDRIGAAVVGWPRQGVSPSGRS